MPRRKRCRHIEKLPGVTLFKPAGIPARDLDIIEIGMDEYEAIRLADMEGLYHEDAATRMNISRQTFGRVIESARRKIANALTEGKGLRINTNDKTSLISKENKTQ